MFDFFPLQVVFKLTPPLNSLLFFILFFATLYLPYQLSDSLLLLPQLNIFAQFEVQEEVLLLTEYDEAEEEGMFLKSFSS